MVVGVHVRYCHGDVHYTCIVIGSVCVCVCVCVGKGAEEKDGLGTCRCNHGYSGDACMECDEGFYNDSNNCIG